YSPGIVKDTKLPSGGFFPASASAADQRPPTDDLVSVRCPRDSFPAAIPNSSSGTGSPSSSATSHLTGRTKRSLVRPGRQYMLLGQESAAISRGSVSPRISAAPRPRRQVLALGRRHPLKLLKRKPNLLRKLLRRYRGLPVLERSLHRRAGYLLFRIRLCRRQPLRHHRQPSRRRKGFNADCMRAFPAVAFRLLPAFPFLPTGG